MNQAIITIRHGDGVEWRVAERVPGGWQADQHYYPDSTVTDVHPLEDLTDD